MKKILVGLIIYSATLYGLFRAFEYFKNGPVKKATKLEQLSKGNASNLPSWDKVSHFKPGSSWRYRGFEGETTKFDVTYELDKNALRVEKNSDSAADSHLILGGCSHIFGVALNSEDTLSSILRPQLNSRNVLNFGFAGGGLHTLLKGMDLVDLKQYVTQSKGYFLYAFELDHLYRWFAAPQYLGWAKPEIVHYEYKDQKLIEVPVMETPQGIKFQVAKKAGLLKTLMSGEAMIWYSEKDLESFLTGLKMLRQKYLAKFPEGKFALVVYPFTPHNETVKLLLKMLKKEKIDYYDSSEEYQEFLTKNSLQNESMIVPIDGHPNRAFNEFMSAKIREHVIK
jgi:hypothetical protein